MQGIRHYFSAICFLSLIASFTLRVNLNVAIVAMVNSSAVYSDVRNESESNGLYCSYNDTLNRNGSQPRDKTKDGEFLWSPATQGIIIGAYFYGYCSCQIVSGRLAELYSRKWVFGIGSFLASVITLLTPLAAYHSVTAIVTVRVLLGISQVIFHSNESYKFFLIFYNLKFSRHLISLVLVYL
nr:putative inorganic phosphate cotransporter [Parasteatoda tepidariorum]